MVRSVSVLVSEALLNQLYDALGVWEKLESGRLVEAPGPEPLTPAIADWCAGGVSYYTRIENAVGLRVGRVHRLHCPGSGVLRFPTYLVVGGARLYRVGHGED